MTIVERIYQNSLNFPNKIAIVCNDTVLSYKTLWQNIVSCCRDFEFMYPKGIIYCLFKNSQNDSFAIKYFANHLFKTINVPVDNDISDDNYSEIADNLDSLIPPSTEHKSIFADNNILFPDENATADIMFTTGTTGKPKGVVLTHNNICASTDNINAFLGNTADDVELIALPLSHSFGLGRLRCVLSKGGTAVILNSFANVKKLFETIENQHCTGFAFVPAAWNYIQKISGDKISKFANQLKYVEIGSSYMSEESKRKLMSLLPDTRICMHYGLTEASRSTFLSFADDIQHLNSIGKPSQNTEIKIFDDGEIGVKGRHVFHKYLNNEPAVFRDGFFLTGDCGTIDSDGYLYLTGRKKEIINVGGKKVSPIEVETILNTFPAIVESCCVGVQNDVYGEIVKAYIVVNQELDNTALRKYLKSKLETYKIPSSFQIVDSLPKTKSGKLQRLELK